MRNKLLVILLLQATAVWSQRVYDFDKSIERLTHGFTEDFSQLIIPGNRVYVMSTEYNSDVDAYVADKIREGITLGVKESKYNLVYQPFFKDHVVRKVYSSDTSFRIQHTSFLRENYKGMRSVLDSLDSYGIDHFIASEVSLNKENQLLSLNVYLVETSTLLVKWAQRYYSDPRFKSSESKKRIGLGIQVSDLVEAESFRDYGTNSSSSIVGPYQDPVRVQSVEVNYDEIVNQKWGAGLHIGGTSVHLPEGFKDTIVGFNSMSISSLDFGASVFATFWPKQKEAGTNWLTVREKVNLSKPTLYDTYVTSTTRAELHLTQSLNIFAGISFFGPIKRSTLQFSEGLTFNQFVLCYGTSLSF